ncbi:MAG: RdgB/HAM1 family non-canonical purine NTP pyrophosphatase [Planctomycetes bacterium]|nr:RdgB/HAM1 family non-canonical purine NTP pyrophosphatase [Planctomycetota bacterium]
MKLVAATGNIDKLKEISAALDGVGVEIIGMKDAGFGGALPPEDALTFEGNAAIKAETVARALGKAAFADDSGLEVDALGGLPGIRSARYAGENSGYAANNAKLLKELEGIPVELRTARFVCMIAMAEPGRETVFFRGETGGRILDAPAGTGGFGYDPLFYSPELGRTFAEDPAGKAKVSHRVRALVKLAEYLRKETGDGRK